MAACIFFGSGVSTRPTTRFAPLPVARLLLVLRAAHTDLVRPLPFGRPHFLPFPASFLAFRSFVDQLLRLSFVDLMPRLGLNSIHSPTLRSSPARHSSLSASTGDREHATPLSRLQRHVVVVRLLTLASGARVGGWAPKIFAGLFAVKGAQALHPLSGARRTELWVWWHAVACHWV